MKGRRLDLISLAGAFAALAGATTVARADQVELGSLTGVSAGDAFGSTLAYGDVDGDGDEDVVVAAITPSTSDGILYVFDDVGGPAMGSVLGFSGEAFGYALDVGDLDGSPGEEIVVGAPLSGSGSGRVVVYGWTPSGGGQLIQKYAAITPTSIGSTLGLTVVSQSFGLSVCIAGDLNADGVSDFVVGAPAATGAIFAFRGSDGAPMGLTSTSSGIFVEALGDTDGDGYDDVVVASVSGSIRVHHGEAQPIIPPPLGSVSYLTSTFFAGSVVPDLGNVATVLGDVNGDQISDFAVGTPGLSQGSGGVSVYFSDTTSGSLNYTGNLDFEHVGDAGGDYLGTSVASAGDVDGDGVTDYAAGARQTGSSGPGYVDVYSGATGARLFRYDGHTGDQAGASLVGAGDRNGDGRTEILVGARQTSTPGAGKVTLVSWTDPSLPLVAAPDYLSLSIGGTHTMEVDAGVANAGKVYFFWGSATGELPAGCYGLAGDWYTNMLINPPGGGFFSGIQGVLDANGRATASISIPAGFDQMDPTTAATLLGTTLYHRVALWEGTPCMSSFLSNVTTLRFDP